jgi:hypothetical protein
MLRQGFCTTTSRHLGSTEKSFLTRKEIDTFLGIHREKNLLHTDVIFFDYFQSAVG